MKPQRASVKVHCTREQISFTKCHGITNSSFADLFFRVTFYERICDNERFMLESLKFNFEMRSNPRNNQLRARLILFFAQLSGYGRGQLLDTANQTATIMGLRRQCFDDHSNKLQSTC